MQKTFIVAELSANHNHQFDTAVATIKAAKKAGADAIKLQTYTADTLTIDCNKPCFMLHGGLWDGYTLYNLYKEAYTPWEWQKDLYKIAQEEGLICFSSPFDKSAIDFLESINNPIYKIASFEITDVGLIEYAARTGKPLIISTGIATAEDIDLALQTCYQNGNKQVTLLKCTSSYPAPIDQANLLTIPDMLHRYPGVKIGVSDHSMTNTIAIAAVALGATVVEKHLILDRKMGGPDSGFSMEPEEFAAMVQSIRETERALGKPYYPTDINQISGRDACRSLFICEDMDAGEILTEKNLRSIRPGNGLPPKYLSELLGKKVNQPLEKGTPMSWTYIQEK